MIGAFLFFVFSVVFALILVLFGIFYKGANQNKQAFFVEEGTMKFQDRGKDFAKLYLNVKDHVYNEETDTIDKGTHKKKWHEEKFGIYWNSILYPIKRIHTFYILKSRLKSEDKLPNKASISDMIEYEGKVEVDNLRFQFTLPLAVLDVDFGDGTRVHFLLFTIWQVVHPYRAIYVHGGEKFFNIITSATEAMLVDYCRAKTYKEYQALAGADFGVEFFKVNDGPTGTIETVGIKAISGVVKEYDISEKDQAIQDATHAAEVARMKALETVNTAQGTKQKTIIEAEGLKKAKELIAESEGVQLQKELSAMIANGVDPNVAANVLREKFKSENIAGKDSKITTYVETGSETMPKTTILLK